MITSLIILFSLLRDFRWPRKKRNGDANKVVNTSSSSSFVRLISELSMEEDASPQTAATTSSTAEATSDKNMQTGGGGGGGKGGLPTDASVENEEDNNCSGSDSPRTGSKHLSEASSNSTSVSTEQTQIDATLGSTSSGTMQSTTSSPLTPGGQLASSPNAHQLAVQQKEQQHNLSSSGDAQTMTNSSSANSTNTMNNSSGNNLRGRHEHRLLSNSSTDTISAFYNLSSHSEGGYGGNGTGNTISGGTTTTGSGHSGVITYPFKIRGDSTASTISTSACSEVLLPPDGGRRSSEGARGLGHRRSSGRVRRYVPRTTISSGGRRRTTGRYFKCLSSLSRDSVLSSSWLSVCLSVGDGDSHFKCHRGMGVS